MKFYCSICGQRYKWYEIVLFGDSPCDDCFRTLKALLETNSNLQSGE